MVDKNKKEFQFAIRIVFSCSIIPGDRDSNFLFLGKLDTQEDRFLEFDGKIARPL